MTGFRHKRIQNCITQSKALLIYYSGGSSPIRKQGTYTLQLLFGAFLKAQ